MTEKPLTPTRIIPAGAPLPGHSPRPGDLPPWWEQPKPPPPPPPPPAVQAPAPAPPPTPVPQVHVHVVVPYEEPPELTRRQRLWAWLTSIGRPWQVCGALALAFAPILWDRNSVATTWAYAVTKTRAEWGQGAGYALALTPLAIAVIRITTGGGTLKRLLLLAVSLVGFVGGAIDLYDPVTWITGVTR